MVESSGILNRICATASSRSLAPRWERWLPLSIIVATFGIGSPGSLRAAECGAGYGDANGDRTIDVLDVQCAAVAALAALVVPAVLPSCAQSWGLLDLNCTDAPGTGAGASAVNLVDVQIALALAQGVPLGALDPGGLGCAERCTRQCGDAVCESVLGEDCAECDADCGACKSPCCAAHAGLGCDSKTVQGCVCAISEFCCEFGWDASCVALAQEFCGAGCVAADCTPDGLIGCGQTLLGSTVGGSQNLLAYPCVAGPGLAGPERLYAFTPTATTQAIAKVTSGGGPLSVAALNNTCTTAGCFAGGAVASFTALAGTTYILSVDGPGGGLAPDFSLSLSCASDCDFDALCGSAECGEVECSGFVKSCGSCPIDTICNGGICQSPAQAGCPGEGSCLESNGSPGCDDSLCCATVCATDAFCCSTQWDTICAGTAASFCAKTCGNGVCQALAGENCQSCPQDCGCPSGQGCLSGSCLACSSPAFCAGNECGPAPCGNTTVQCGMCPAGSACWQGECLGEQNCAPSATIECGGVATGNTQGAQSLIQTYGECIGEVFPGGEVAYSFVAPATTQIEVALLTSQGPTWLFVLQPECSGAACVGGGYQSAILQVQAGLEYLIVVEHEEPGGGPFTLALNCQDQCSPEVVCAELECGSIPCVNTIVGCGTCPLGSYCSGGACLPVGTFPACPGSGNCFAQNGTPGCDIASCCNIVCNFDPFCCNTAWDSICGNEAKQFCLSGCGNGVCEPALGENCSLCLQDCPCDAGQACQNGQCGAAPLCGPLQGALGCGNVATGNTVGGASQLNGYACTSANLSAPERVYPFVSGVNSQVEVKFTGVSGQQVVVLGPGCSADQCVANSNASGSVVFAADGGQTYYLVVDGTAPAIGNFSIQPTCLSECSPEVVCGGQQCGEQTCGGEPLSCGSCPVGQQCLAGTCSL